MTERQPPAQWCWCPDVPEDQEPHDCSETHTRGRQCQYDGAHVHPGMPEKLVRDRIPAIIRATGEEPVTRTASLAEYPALLRDKLAEETAEYLASGDPAELADILEVLHALAGLHGISPGELESVRTAKHQERGGFDGRVVWSGNLALALSREDGTDGD